VTPIKTQDLRNVGGGKEGPSYLTPWAQGIITQSGEVKERRKTLITTFT